MSLKDFQVKPFDESGLQNAKGAPEAGFPIEVDEQEKNIFVPNQQPIVNSEQQIEKPGFFETLGHSWYKTSEITQAYDYLQIPQYAMNPLDDQSGQDFDATDINHYLDIDNHYWGALYGATSSKDMQMRREWALNQMQEEEYFANGSTTAKILGGFGGVFTSPTTYAFGVPAVLKYAKFSENLVKNTLKAAPGITANAVAHEGFMQATDVGGNLSDFAQNVMIDELFGLALVGGGAALAPAITGGKLWNMRKIMGESADGVVFKDVIENGEHVGWQAASAPGFDLSAAKVKSAQELADATFKESGLFAIPGVTRLAGAFNPIVKGLSSKSEVVRDAWNKVASHGFITKGIDEGKARAPSVQDLMSNLRASQTKYDLDYRRAFLKANGIKPGLQYSDAVNLFRKQSEEGFLSPDDFGQRVRQVFATGVKNENQAVNEIALKTKKQIEEILLPFAEAHGLDPESFTSTFGVDYLMRNWHVDKLVNYEDGIGGFVPHISSILAEQDAKIEELMAPIHNLERAIKTEAESKLGGKGHTEQQAVRQKMLKARLKEAKLNLEKTLRDNKDYKVLLEEHNFLTSDEANELDNLLKPIQIAKQEIEQTKTKIQRLKEKRSRKKSQAIEVQDKDLQLKHQKTLEDIEKQLGELNEHLEKLDAERLDEDFKLRERAEAGEINRKFWYRNKETGIIDFRNPDETIKLRKPYETKEARDGAARAYHSTLTGNNPEQISNQVLSTMYPQLFANPLKKRSIMIMDKDVLDWLDHDIAKSVATYRNALGRKTIMKNVFGNSFDHEDDMGGLFTALKEEHDANKQKLMAKYKGEELQKKLAKEHREFNKNKENLSNLFKSQFQAAESSAVNDIIKTLKNYSVVKHLGSVPLLMMSDLFGVVLKQGVWDFFTAGLIPAISSLNGAIKSKNGIHFRENSADVGVALNHVQHGYLTKFQNNESMNYVPTQGYSGRAYNFSQNLAHMSGNMYGTNYIENFIERVAAGTAQSRIMRLMKKYQSGSKLSKSEDLSLRMYGLNPEEDAAEFLSQFKQHGYEENGGYYSNWWNWANDEASNKMKMAIRLAVSDSSVKANALDKPFWLHNDAFTFVSQFMGWGFSAFSRYTIPTMQRLDADKAMGLMLMFAAGSLTDPLRRWSRGEEFNYGEDNNLKWFFSSLNNSGITGVLLDGFEGAVNATGTGLLDSIKNDKYHYRDQTFGNYGPAGSVMGDAVSFFSMAATQDWNQADIKRGARTVIPISNAFYFKNLVNKFVESFNIPERPQRGK